jgi:hypothetical protein
MINIAYAKAYTEVLEIIKYFPKEEYAKIPEEKIEFYKNNMDKDYNFKINPEIDLSEQSISPEANAIMINLFTDYYATEEQKIKIKNILDSNQQKEEQEKRERYNPDNIFKNRNTENIIQNEVALVEYKESIFKRFINKIKSIFNIK